MQLKYNKWLCQSWPVSLRFIPHLSLLCFLSQGVLGLRAISQAPMLAGFHVPMLSHWEALWGAGGVRVWVEGGKKQEAGASPSHSLHLKWLLWQRLHFLCVSLSVF